MPLDRNLPITESSIGGFKLLEHINTYWDLVEKNYGRNQTKDLYRLEKYHTVRYGFEDLHVELSIDVRTGIIYRITALAGYQGKFLNNIGIGTPIPDVLSMDLGFEYRDAEDAFQTTKYYNLWLEQNISDPLPEDYPDLKIESITISDRDYIDIATGHKPGWASY